MFGIVAGEEPLEKSEPDRGDDTGDVTGGVASAEDTDDDICWLYICGLYICELYICGLYAPLIVLVLFIITGIPSLGLRGERTGDMTGETPTYHDVVLLRIVVGADDAIGWCGTRGDATGDMAGVTPA
jgi:hypothetical protein